MIKTNSIISFFLLISVISSVLSNFVSILSYSDEVLTVIYIVIIAIIFFRNKKVDRTLHYVLFVFFSVILIGLLSNFLSRLKILPFPMVTDILMSLKLLITFTFYYSISSASTRDHVSNSLRRFSQISILVLFILGTISQFINTNLTLTERRYGLKPFNFVYDFAGDTGFLVIAFLLIMLMHSKKLSKIDYMYILLGSIVILETTKIQVMVFPIALICMGILKKFKLKLNTLSILIIGLVLLLAGYSQLHEYFLDSTHYSPRKIMLLDSIRLANQNFPLGTGFGSFGSEMASRYYSPIYFSLGYIYLYGLNGNMEVSALNDNYLAMIIAQFGWVGAILYYSIFFVIVRISLRLENVRLKVLGLSTVITYVIASIGSGTIKSSTGVIAFGILGIILADRKKN